jgi:hypothetical protein
VHTARDVPPGAVAAIVLGEIATRQGAVVAIAELDQPVGEPRVIVGLGIPKMQMCISN